MLCFGEQAYSFFDPIILQRRGVVEFELHERT